MAVLPDGSVALGGTFATVSGQALKNIAVVDGTTGRALESFTASAGQRQRSRRDHPEGTNGVLYVGGKFSNLNGSSGSGYLTSVNPDTGEVLDWNPPVSYLVNEIDADATTV